MKRKHVPLYEDYIAIDGHEMNKVNRSLDDSNRYYDRTECMAMFDFLVFFRQALPEMSEEDVDHIADRFGEQVAQVVQHANLDDLYYGQQGVPETGDSGARALDTRQFLQRFDEIRDFLMGLIPDDQS